MRISRKVRIVLISSMVAVVTCGVIVWIYLPKFETWSTGFHQKSVTRSLARWGLEDSIITNDASAIHAIEMIGYMSAYYVPGPGYRGPVEVEAALEKQRRESIDRLVASLERYSGLDYGTDVERWTEWAAKRVSEPDGATNGSQPFRSETNSTSSTAGSRR